MYKQIAASTFQELAAIAQHATRGANTVVMHAGHFLLFQDAIDNRVMPCIGSELREPRHDDIRSRFGAFPELSWALGLRLLSQLESRNKYVMIVVNDWQYLPAGQRRLDFFTDTTRLPVSYARELEKHPEITLLRASAGHSESHLFFSEASLRNRYRKHVKKLILSGALPPDARVHRLGGVVTAQLLDGSKGKREIYCSERSTDCSGETAQFLDESSKATGCQTFINLFPRVCWEPVEYGTQLAPRLFTTETRTFLNIGFDSTDVRDEESLIETSQCALHER